ncbi:unnamed protein product [Fraxinus pennsylvanica]|uniref:Myb-like domain-containing protein n=1 Tax=Fraxinus pennsylvanica TaxID=56036 RepID=A0AAD2DL81_9LAMI|nr:unnamed protein product [Fraxinus pennsylvanica]
MNFSFSSSTSFNENEISFISSKIPQKSEDWTIEENALFEKAIGDHNIEFPYIFNKIASIIPGKTIEQIKEHYKALVEDVDMIKSGHVPLPNYTEIDNNKPKSALRRERKSTQEQKTKSIRWTKEEHEYIHKYLFNYLHSFLRPAVEERGMPIPPSSSTAFRIPLVHALSPPPPQCKGWTQ